MLTGWEAGHQREMVGAPAQAVVRSLETSQDQNFFSLKLTCSPGTKRWLKVLVGRGARWGTFGPRNSQE